MSARPGLATRDDLLNWANTVPSQTEFPRLVRRLVMETCPGITSLGFPAGSGAALGSWDGSVRTTGGNAFVPDGLSLWELSVKKSITKKADDDYAKRTTTPDGSPTSDCVYIEAILRPWAERNEWAVGKQADRRWKGVRAYGVDDIETWLEHAPVTHAWVSEVLGFGPHGYRAAESWWRTWSHATNPSLPPELVLAGRDAAYNDLVNRLSGSPQVVSISGGSIEELLGFVAAVLYKRRMEGSPRELSRTAFVDSPGSWRALEERPSPIILVAATDDAKREISGAGSDRHHIIVPVTTGVASDIELSPIDAKGATDALVAAGLSEERRAQDSGHLARRSVVALRRHLAVKPELHSPWWATAPGRSVRGTLLAGRWREDVNGDRDVVAELAGEAYEPALAETLAGLAAAEDPFVSRLGASWALVSLFDAWIQLKPHLRGDDLERLEPIALKVLLEPDPALEMRPEDRWRANLEGKVRSYSGELRHGLAVTLAMLGSQGDAIETNTGATGQQVAAHVVRQILGAANNDATGGTWNSVADLLQILAEAAPDVFLDAVRTGSAGTDPVIRKLFIEHGDQGPFGPSSQHPNLLWALERLAWSAEHFGEVVQVLARLSEIDPGGRTGNRPFESLTGILWPYRPEASASETSRLAAIDTVRQFHTEIGWRLLLALLPESHAFHLVHPEPEFRDWRTANPEPATIRDVIRFTGFLVNRLLEDIDKSAARWKELFERIGNLPSADRARVRAGLEQLVAADELHPEGQRDLWDSLRALVAKHRTYSDAQWALPEVEIAELDAITQRLRPTDSVDSESWLFEDHTPDLPEPPS